MLTPSDALILASWLDAELYRAVAVEFFRNEICGSARSREEAIFHGTWLKRQAYPRSVGRRIDGIAVEIREARSPALLEWVPVVLGGEEVPAGLPAVESEGARFRDYLVSEKKTHEAYLAETFPGCEHDARWAPDPDLLPKIQKDYPGHLTPAKTMGQIVGKFPEFESHPACQEFKRQFKWLDEDEQKEFHATVESYKKKGRAIEGMTPWLFLNEPVFRHYRFSARQILALAVVLNIYGGKGAARFSKAFDLDDTPFKPVLTADHSGKFLQRLTAKQRRLAEQFEDFLATEETAFRKFLEARLPKIRGKGRSENVFPFCNLVLKFEFDTKTVYHSS